MIVYRFLFYGSERDLAGVAIILGYILHVGLVLAAVAVSERWRRIVCGVFVALLILDLCICVAGFGKYIGFGE
jgi:hypothetical protein